MSSFSITETVGLVTGANRGIGRSIVEALCEAGASKVYAAARRTDTLAPLVDYRYAPGTSVPKAYARALDPTRTNPNARSDPQQTLSLGLSQNFEAKLRPAAGDSGEPRKLRLLSHEVPAGGIGSWASSSE